MYSCQLVSSLRWPEVVKALEGDCLAVLPIGAACKEHGLHLPLNTDAVQAEWMARSTGLFCNSLIWPTVSYAYYPAFVDYPGSCSIAAETFAQSVQDILRGLTGAGANHVLIINTGISTIRPLEEMLSKLNQHDRISLFNAYSGTHFTDVSKALQQQVDGQHADEVETSIMLALAPELVDMDKAQCSEGTFQPGALNRLHADRINYSPSGVIGDARLATEGKGRQLTKSILADMEDQINRIMTGV